MNKKTKFLTAVGAIALGLAGGTAGAHMEPKKNSDKEKCYGVAKAHKNDCASADGKHKCSGRSKVDRGPNEWVKLPEGLCDKLTGGSLTPPPEVEEEEEEEHDDHHH